MGVCWISGIPLSIQAGAALKETIHVSLSVCHYWLVAHQLTNPILWVSPSAWGLGCTPALLHTEPPCPLNSGCETSPRTVACVEPHSPGPCHLPRSSLTQPRHLPLLYPQPLWRYGKWGGPFPLISIPHSLRRWIPGGICPATATRRSQAGSAP